MDERRLVRFLNRQTSRLLLRRHQLLTGPILSTQVLPSVTEVHEVTRLNWGQASYPMMHFRMTSSKSRKHVRPSMSSDYVCSVLANGSGWRRQEIAKTYFG